MNLAGVVRQLPLFEPPIDPALLVKAAAAGIDLGTRAVGRRRAAAASTGAWRCCRRRSTSPPTCAPSATSSSARCRTSTPRALSLLRSTHELAMLDAVTALKTDAIALADADTAALEQSQAIAQGKHDYYSSRDFMNALRDHRAVAQRRVGTGPDGDRPRLLAGRRAGADPQVHHRRVRLRRLARRRGRHPRRHPVLQGRGVRGRHARGDRLGRRQVGRDGLDRRRLRAAARRLEVQRRPGVASSWPRSPSSSTARPSAPRSPSGSWRTTSCRSSSPPRSTSTCTPSTPTTSCTTGWSSRSRPSTSRATNWRSTWPSGPRRR